MLLAGGSSRAMLASVRLSCNCLAHFKHVYDDDVLFCFRRLVKRINLFARQ